MSRKALAATNQKELVFKGEEGLHRIISRKSEVQAALEEVDELWIDISEISNFDPALLQLLCSAHRSAVQMGKSVGLTGNLPDFFYPKLEEAGFARQVGCKPDGRESCIWVVQGD